MADPVRIAAIKDELETGGAAATPPIAYAAPNAGVEADAVADAALMAAVARVVDVETLSASELFEAIDATEWSDGTLDATDQANVRLILSLGDNIKIAPGTKARAILVAALTGATASLAALAVIGSRTVSRSEELKFGRVTIGQIQLARVS